MTPPTYAVWNTAMRPGPVLATARPGIAGSKCAASLMPTMSDESSASATRSATLRLVFARRLPLITPAGR